VIYDLVHKRTALAPVLMAGCRSLLYLVAASSSSMGGPNANILWRATALAAYILGLSYLARRENTGALVRPWCIVLLLTPIAVGAIFPMASAARLAIPAAALSLWTYWCFSTLRPKALNFLPKSVSGLLAGIALVDWLAAAGHGFAPAFLGLFVLALVLQRLAPAT
jgi:4-hydroxybenzoate polyprenyltransferase